MNQALAIKTRANQDLATALADAEERYIATHSGSAKLYAEAAANLPGGNTRTTLHFSPFPIYVASGKGGRLTDVDGHVYNDFINEYTAGVFGHSNSLIAETVAATISQGMNFGAPTRHEILLSGEVRSRFPAMELLRFCNSGTEANLLALATARAATGRDAVMIFNGAYHVSLFYFSHGPSPLNMPFPIVTSTFNDIERMTADIESNAGRLAAVIIEPMQGGAGALPAEAAFLKALRAATAKHGIVLVADEVMTSRTHFGGLQARFDIRPDMVTLGKYIAGGLTIGAFGGRADLMRRFDPSRSDAFPHGGTFNNNVIAMAAGYAALTKVLTKEAMARMNGLGDDLRDRLNDCAQKRDCPMIATGIGSIFGIHFHKGRLRNVDDLDAGERGREAEISQLKKLFHLDMIDAGQYISRRVMGNLSLETSRADTDELVDAVDEFLVNRGRLLNAALA